VTPQGREVARGHLRIATAPATARSRADNRLLLLLRALLVSARVALRSAAAWGAAAVALLPLAIRRAPLGRRRRPQPRREARVIPFQPRRQAMPR
jgi:hypothetical protein